MTLSKLPRAPRGYRHLFTDQEVIDLYQANSLENMATLVSRRCGRKVSRETVRLWVCALADEGLVTMGRFVEEPPITKQRLQRLYVTEQKGAESIASLLKKEGISCSPTSVRTWLRYFDIPTRDHKESAAIVAAKYIKPRKLSEAEVLKLFNEGMSHHKIAELLSEPGSQVYPGGVRRMVLRAQKAIGGELRPRIKNTWTKGVPRTPSPIIRGAICPQCHEENSGTCGGYVAWTPSFGKRAGIQMERCAFKCRSCGKLWHHRAPHGWVASMRQHGAIPAQGEAS